MEQILKDEPNLRLLGPSQLKKRLKGRVSPKDIDTFLKAQDTRQLETPARPRKRSEQFKIAAHPGSFQIDVCVWGYARQNAGQSCMLLLVDVPSRKAFAQPLKSQDDASLIKAFLELVEEHGLADKLTTLQGDAQFGSKLFTETCEALKINLWTQTAKEDHISGGNVLGIIDAVTKLLKNSFRRWSEEHDSTRWTAFLKDGLAALNSTPNSGLQDRSPDEVFKDSPISQLQREGIDMAHNRSVYAQSKKFEVGQKVRILEEKQILTKGKNRWSRAVYTVSRPDKLKYLVKDEHGTEQTRRFKSNELLPVVDTAQTVPAPRRVSAAKTQQRTVRKVTHEEGIAPHEPTVAAIGQAPKRTTRSTVPPAKEKLRERPAPATKPAPAPKPSRRKLFKDLNLPVGTLLIMGGSDESSKATLTIKRGSDVGYVHAGWVVKRDVKNMYMRWLVGTRPKQGLGTKLGLAKEVEGLPLSNWASVMLHHSQSMPEPAPGSKTTLPPAVVDAVAAKYRWG